MESVCSNCAHVGAQKTESQSRVLQPNQCLDDQTGSFPCLNKAYGPYEAIQLNARNSNLAKINIENYVWYALVSCQY